MPLVRTELTEGVGVVTLADPERRNALSAGLLAELTAAFDALEAAEDVAAVVVTGEGPAFCAGAVLDDLLTAVDGDTAPVEQVYEGFDRVRRSPLLTVAAVQGPAVGAGLNLALACDIRVAGLSAWFDTRFLRIGLHPGGGHLRMLEQLVGPQTAAAMVLCGERLDARTAQERGLVLRAAPDDELLATARGLAGRAAAAGRDLVVSVKQTLRESPAMTAEQALAVEAERQRRSFARPATAALLRGAASRAPGSGVTARDRQEN
ncbi:enoyl-CoA hydratase-related protein [Streptomyces meridianus]|uniref:Enoyl-CoA hydratase-related protein n=1 Tax=Streptomyces meridianus TaxID=2938945 RepID=A0ABT0XAS4_9ACTN|nr:enoyl-CoA hydratase-related protein [Streptomyces meridianus]MCM2579631.1 enoyl-CoA hydratase-related protein [Streptomyces meridianus]